MPAPQIAQRLAELLIDPRETLEVEIKGWIDIVNDGDHKAGLAKAIIALANHGGGVVTIGFEKSANGMVAAGGRPASLVGYTPDTVNAVVNRYAEPAFHCDVQTVLRPGTTESYPIVVVPGGHTVPIRAKRSGPNGQTIQQNTYYIRRPGPQSEAPQTGQEWDTLIRRCLSNGREEMLNGIRLLLAGGATATPVETDLERVTRWFETSKTRWNELAETLPPDYSARFPLGHYALGYQIIADFEPRSGSEMLEALRAGTVRHTGWPPFWVPTRKGIEPYIQDGNVECWLGRESQIGDPAHSDFWRVSPQGQFFLIRGYQEDGPEVKHGASGKLFDITLPTWRLGEAMLHASSMAHQLGAPQANVVAVAEWTGLAGRELTHLAGTRSIFDGHVARQNSYQTSFAIQADKIEDSLPELVHRALYRLYELFDFFKLPVALVTEELAKMRSGRF